MTICQIANSILAPDTDDQMKVGKMKVDKITKLLSLNDCTQNDLIQNKSW